MVSRKTFSLLVVLWICSYGASEGRSVLGVEEEQDDLELETQLKLLNKPPVNTFELDYGTFDCVDIYKQPAFDHPLLKNHKIQLAPTRSPNDDRKITSEKSKFLAGFGLPSSCPKGTVPIRRTTKEDLIRQKSFGRRPDSYLIDAAPNSDSSHYARFAIQKDSAQQFLGGKAYINIQNPNCNQGEYSGALIWLFDLGGSGQLNGVAGGWMVDPSIYGDSRTYFTSIWTGDSGGGCANVQCPGFVQIDQTFPVGSLIPNISVPEQHQFSMYTFIHQDLNTKNWWLTATEDKKSIGYWPKELFSNLNDGADNLAFGGTVAGVLGQSSPSMGSGLANCDDEYTAYFRNMEYQVSDGSGSFITPTTGLKYVDCPVYDLLGPCPGTVRKDFGAYFLFGGSRGNCPS